MTQHIDDAIGYARDVVGGSIPACLHVRLACQRTLDDLEAAEAGGPWEFRPDLAEKVVKFCELLPNIKGPLANKPLRLSPWQKYIIANVFGFVERGTTTRRFRQATVFCPRGQGKTTLAAPLAVYMSFFEGEGGAETYAAAVSRDQARILWDSAAAMLRNTPKLTQRAGIAVNAHSLFQLKTASKFIPVSSDAKSLEGLSVHCAILDEIASHPTDLVYNAILTGTGKRKHPLIISISTATGNTTGIGKQLWDYAAKVVAGEQEDERLFALLYTIDDDDDPWDELSWIKANPGWGLSVQPDAIRAIFKQARNNPAREAAAFTRHLNKWVGADEALFSTRAWRDCADPALDIADFAGRDCHVAVDLASRQDIAGIAICFPEFRDGRTHYTVFARAFLNEDSVAQAKNPSYPAWAADNRLIVTPGNETDYAEIEATILDLCRAYNALSVSFDPWNGQQMMQRLGAEGLPVVEYRQNVQGLSAPTLEAGAAMAAGRIHHDGDPVLTWCVANVTGRYDRTGNVLPTKQRPEQKIDLAVAMIMAIGRSMHYVDSKTSVYEHRGLFVIG